MKTLLLFAFLTSQLALATQLPADDLYQILKTRFEASTTAADLRLLKIKSVDEKSIFSGCSFISDKGKLTTTVGAVVVPFKITITPGAGPLKPAVVNRYTQYVDPEWLPYIIKYGGKFINGEMDLDSVTFGTGTEKDCMDSTTYEDSWKYVLSYLNHQANSFIVQSRCRTGRIRETVQFRWSETYLIAKLESEKEQIYSYCWK